MATHSSILAWKNPIDRGAWRAAVHGVARGRHDWATKPPPLCRILESTFKWYHVVSVFLWLMSPSVIISSSIMLPQMAIISFLVWLGSIHTLHMGHIFFTHSSVDGHLSCFCVLDTVNHASVNTGVHVSVWITVLSGYMPSSGIAGPYGNSGFSFLRTLHTAFHSGCPSVHPHP